MRVDVPDDELLPRKVWGWLVKYRAHFKCEDCGADDVQLQAHHLDQDSTNNVLANGRALCVGCHATAHTIARALVRSPVDREAIEVANVKLRDRGLVPAARGPVPHIRAKIAEGKRLRQSQYVIAVRRNIYVPPELRPGGAS